MINPIIYIVCFIISPCIIAFVSRKLLKSKSWIIIGIEVMIIMLLTFIGIIENNPMGNAQRQLISYFGNLTNDFYIKYVPFIVISIIVMNVVKKNSNAQETYKRRNE